MEEADGIIIPILQSIGCNVKKDVTSFKQFNKNIFVESLVKCLHIIDDKYTYVKSIFPKSKAKAYGVCNQLTNILKNDLGYRGEIGFDTFFYSNEKDVRKIIRFVVQKLPEKTTNKRRDRSDSVISGGGGDYDDDEQDDFTSKGLLDKRINNGLKKWIKKEYSILSIGNNIYNYNTYNIEYPNMNNDNNIDDNGINNINKSDEYIKYCNNNKSMSYICNQINNDNYFIPSILNYNHKQYMTSQASNIDDDNDNDNDDDNRSKMINDIFGEFNINSIKEMMKTDIKNAKNNTNVFKIDVNSNNNKLNNNNNDDIMNKSNFVLKKEFMTKKEDQIVIARDENDNEIQISTKTKEVKKVGETDEETEKRRKEEIDIMKNKIEKLKERLNKMDFEIEKKSNELEQKSKEKDEMKSEYKQLESEYYKVKKTIDLLPNGEENIVKLNKIVVNTNNKFENLKKKWGVKKTEYINQIEAKKREIDDRYL